MHAEPNALPEEDEPAVTPGDDSNDDPTPPLPVEPSETPQRNPAVDQAANDSQSAQAKKEEPEPEPEPGNERDIPSDGRDLEGERMIRELDPPVEPSPAQPQQRK
jgi:hypothetical protein